MQGSTRSLDRSSPTRRRRTSADTKKRQRSPEPRYHPVKNRPSKVFRLYHSKILTQILFPVLILISFPIYFRLQLNNVMVDPIFDYQFRVILIGDSAVGKSSLLRKFTFGSFAEVRPANLSQITTTPKWQICSVLAISYLGADHHF